MISPGRPKLDRDSRREAILDVAEGVFVEQGFSAASKSEIAARLGGSKGTLYNSFKSKDELFEAYVQRRCVLNLDEIYVMQAKGETARELLMRLGVAFVRKVLSDDNLRHFRLIMAEAQRSPEIGRAFYEAGPLKGAERLAARIEEWVAAGEIETDDPLLAAHHFLALCQNRHFKARLANYAPELTPKQIEAEVTAATDVFLRAYGARAYS